MKLTLKIFIFLLSVSLLNSCLTKGKMLKGPCRGEEFLRDLHNYSKAELTKLARVLESSTYGSPKDDGCRDALLGRIYSALERSSEASDYFSSAAKKLPELSDYFNLAKANADVKRQNFNQAQKIADALLNSRASMQSPQFALRVRKVLADIAVGKKDDQQVIKTHEDLIQRGYSEDEAMLFNLASALTNVGEHGKANDVYKQLLISFPLSPGAKRATELQNLAQYQLDLKETEKRFDRLIEKLAFDRVVADADLLIKNGSKFDNNAKGHLRSLALKSLLLNNKFEAGIRRGRQMAMRPNATPKELEGYAWALAKVGHHIEAADAYGKFHRAAAEKEDKARGCFFHGFSLYEASLYSMAMFAWQSCHAAIEGTSHYENYLWYQALASMLNNNHSKANSLLLDLKSLFPRSPDREKYVYFLGYTFRMLDKKDESATAFGELSKRRDPSYYVLLARHSLRLVSPQGDAISADALQKLIKNRENPDCKNALILFHLGFKEEARDLINRSSAPLGDKLAMLQHMGFYHEVWQKAHLLKPEATISGRAFRANHQLRGSYPLPHRKIVDDNSKKYGIEKSLLYAIMRAESGFLAHAMSSRGALGLMQMMPFVAHDLASRLSLEEFTSEHLKDPSISIELGALFVATLKRQFNSPHLVVAAYNAGPHQVQKWLNAFGDLPTELFVERIPFKQTRDYVKKVLPSESIYHATHGKELRLSF